ncbi:hypothetical protein Sjap_018802 [Stephania japonica]|uniref:Uncharacterized protein n=1 Tax=Stephania japonica TaxID=461633 RepID=A0AAP0I8T0_9MAGN
MPSALPSVSFSYTPVVGDETSLSLSLLSVFSPVFSSSLDCHHHPSTTLDSRPSSETPRSSKQACRGWWDCPWSRLIEGNPPMTPLVRGGFPPYVAVMFSMSVCWTVLVGCVDVNH